MLLRQSLIMILRTIEIDGLGTFQVQSFTNIYVSRDVASAGYEYDLSRGYDDDDLYDTDSNTAFSTWDMSTSIGQFQSTASFCSGIVSFFVSMLVPTP